MNRQLPAIIGWLLLGIAFSGYAYGIYAIIWHTSTSPDGTLAIPAPLENIVTTLNAILLTNLGAVLGIAVAKPSSGLAGITLIGSSKLVTPDPVTQREIIQYVAVIVYLLALILCAFHWIYAAVQAPPLKVHEIVEQSGKTLIGVIVAYVAFVLGTRN